MELVAGLGRVLELPQLSGSSARAWAAWSLACSSCLMSSLVQPSARTVGVFLSCLRNGRPEDLWGDGRPCVALLFPEEAGQDGEQSISASLFAASQLVPEVSPVRHEVHGWLMKVVPSKKVWVKARLGDVVLVHLWAAAAPFLVACVAHCWKL